VNHAGACDVDVRNDGMWYWPLNIPGEGRTVATPAGCRQRCADHPDCYYFNSFPNMGCHLSGKDAKLATVPHNPTRASGAVRCQVCDIDVKNDGMWYWPLNIPGEGRTEHVAAEGCRQRCFNHPDCYYFNFFPNGGCHLSGKNAKLKTVSHNPTRASGAVRCERPIFWQKATSGECLSSQNSDIGLAFGNTPHTIHVQLTFPQSAPGLRQWILNLGQSNFGAQHWLWNSETKTQIGMWGGLQAGAQINVPFISDCTDLTTTYSGSVFKLYCNGRLLGQKNVGFNIGSSQLSIGKTRVGGERDFAGCISEVKIWASERTAAEVAEENSPAFWETCRWHSVLDQSLANTQDFMGWTCQDDEILTGFGLTANDNDITKIKCCSIGGHSSVKSDTCSFIEVDQGVSSGNAVCGNNQDHKVFSGAYDKRLGESGDAFTEVLAGKCCEVECDAGWCAGRNWGVDKSKCQVKIAQGNAAQDLVCPTGTLLTEIRDAQSGSAKGVQKIGSVKCCELDLVAEPTMMPTPAPSPAPTSSPTDSPTSSPTTRTQCLLSVKGLPNSQYLRGLADCLPPACGVPAARRRALESRLTSEGDASE